MADRTKLKLVLLELIAGICGCAWIIAGVAALYLLLMAIFLDSPWSRVFWAVAVSVVAKWLARGFEDHKQRIAFEADLIARGHTPAEAAKEWIARYAGQKKPSDPQLGE